MNHSHGNTAWRNATGECLDLWVGSDLVEQRSALFVFGMRVMGALDALENERGNIGPVHDVRP
jgi:hypothetical protein